MFSTLNYLIDAPMEEILEEVPVSDHIKNALLTKEGRCGMLYDLVLSYETADWGKIASLAEELGIPNNMLTTVYFICMENVNTLWEQLTNACPYQEEEQENGEQKDAEVPAEES
jgi:EAL and modified HD-GYP domain-containing signal transduction protein